MTTAPIEGRGYTIHQLFNGHRYQLDYYQREYTWSSENVRRLVDDLHSRFSKQRDAFHGRRDTSRYKPYFLGIRPGSASPPWRPAGPAERTRVRYGVDIPQLMSVGLLKAGDTLIAIHRGTEHQAIILDDGRIKLAGGGKPFTCLSSAATYAKRTKSANGWEFWQLQSRRERRPLKEIRDELVRGER